MKNAFSFILAIAILVLCSSCSGANTLTDEEIELFRNMMTTNITSDSTSVNSTFDNDERITTTIIKDITMTKKAEIRTTNKPAPTSSPTTECSHSYFERTVNPTCTEEGYTIHTCEKCGKSFKDSIIPSRHKYMNFYCSECGAADTAHPYETLYAWLVKNGNKDDDGDYYISRSKNNGNDYYRVHTYGNRLRIGYGGYVGGEYTIAYVDFPCVSDEYVCHIYSSELYVNGSATIQANTFGNDTEIVFDSFYTDTEYTETVFAIVFRDIILDALDEAEDLLSIHSVGISIRDFGFAFAM